MAFDYPGAGGPNAQPEVQDAVDRYRRLPMASAYKRDLPLLYWLIGSGTPSYKMGRLESRYGPPPAELAHQRCKNCASAYMHVVTGSYICSQIEGPIAPESWCRVWNTDRDGGYA